MTFGEALSANAGIYDAVYFNIPGGGSLSDVIHLESAVIVFVPTYVTIRRTTVDDFATANFQSFLLTHILKIIEIHLVQNTGSEIPGYVIAVKSHTIPSSGFSTSSSPK